jgi:hypothetical protein
LISGSPDPWTWTFTVWPEFAPTFEDGAVWFPLADTPLPEIIVEAGSTFYVVLDERPYSPNGFGWEEPTHEFGCVNVLNTNFMNHKTGYRVWMV